MSAIGSATKLRAVIAYARQEWPLRDGADGETVHALIDAAEAYLSLAEATRRLVGTIALGGRPLDVWGVDIMTATGPVIDALAAYGKAR